MKNIVKNSEIFYPKDKTALILVDPFNDFLSKGGVAWPLVKTTVKEVGTKEHIADLLKVARAEGIVVAYAPHHRYRKGSHSERKYLHPAHYQQINLGKSFGQGKWGGEFVEMLAPEGSDFIASEHACSSGFAGTDLHDHLQEKGTTHVIIIGMLTNSCIEATVRSAIDLNYHVTLVTDAVAAFSPLEHKQAIKERYPLLGHIVTTTQDVVQKIKMN
jgi:nicotinamidase-related amidase